MNLFAVSFFGHREIDDPFVIERQLESIIRELLLTKEYVEFLVGRDGEFDQLVSSTVRRCKRTIRGDNSSLVLVLPYMTAEYRNNEESFHEYYDEIEICLESAEKHFKSAHQVRNRSMVDRSDLVIFCIEHNSGGAYQTMQYAKKADAKIMNLPDVPLPVDSMDSCEEMMIQDWPGALYEKDDTAFLCWTYSPEVTYVLEYTPSKIDDSEIIKMAESAEPVK